MDDILKNIFGGADSRKAAEAGSMDLADLEIVDQEGHVRPEEVMATDSEMDLEIMDSAEKEISVRMVPM